MAILQNTLDKIQARQASAQDPWAPIIEQLQQRLAQPQTPTYSPEEVAQRRAGNERQYALGLAGMLSGDETMGNVGGLVFKQALAQRQPHVSDKGIYDPLSGEYKLNAEARQQTLQDQLERVYQ